MQEALWWIIPAAMRTLPVHQRLIHWLEERGDLDRALEFLPSDSEVDRRFQDGLGLKSPEFSVLVAYAKLALKKDILAKLTSVTVGVFCGPCTVGETGTVVIDNIAFEK